MAAGDNLRAVAKATRQTVAQRKQQIDKHHSQMQELARTVDQMRQNITELERQIHEAETQISELDRQARDADSAEQQAKKLVV